jgi:hypothetical protein
MVPTPLRLTHSSRLITLLYSLASNYVSGNLNPNSHLLVTRAQKEKHDTKFIVFACLIPVLVLLSGVFAGLTLGYMSLDETQLNVLSISGTPSVPPPPTFPLLTHLTNLTANNASTRTASNQSAQTATSCSSLSSWQT